MSQFEKEALAYFENEVGRGIIQRIDGIECFSPLSDFWFWRMRLDRMVRRGLLIKRGIGSIWPSCDGMPGYGIAGPAPQTISLGEDGEQFLTDAIRSAYDRGYNDARIPLNLPRDNAPGYRGRDISEEIVIDVLARLRRIQSPAPNVVARLREELLSAACLLETLAEDLPDDDVPGVMMSVMAKRNRAVLAATATEGER